MKKLLAISFVLTAFVFASSAQVHRQSKGIQKGSSQHMNKKMEGLNLTESQKADIKKIREEQKSQMETLKSSGQSQEDIQKQRKAIMETYRTKVQTVLTTEQKEKMKEQRLNKKENKRQKTFRYCHATTKRDRHFAFGTCNNACCRRYHDSF